MTPLTPTAILHNLSTAALPREVLCYAQVGSTMDIARQELPQRTTDRLPLLITADEQTTGRGRMQRPWVVPPGSALLFSLAMRPHWLAPANGTMLVWMAGVALCEGIAEATGLSPRLKWPNDVMLPVDDATQTTYHKVAGILLESASGHEAMSWAILGCGINVSASPPPDQTRYPATHVEAVLNNQVTHQIQETGINQHDPAVRSLRSLRSLRFKTVQRNEVSRLTLLRSLLISMDRWYTHLQQGEHSKLFAAWRDLLITLGQNVTIQTADGVRQGYAEGVEPTGALRIRDAAGIVHIVTSGDVGM